MHFAAQLFLYVAIASFALLIFGLFRPWLALWWEDVQNRRKVIRLYGVIMLIFFSLYLLTDQIYQLQK